MKTPEQARAILAAAHTVMPAELVSAHAQQLSVVVASNDQTIRDLCETIAFLTGIPSRHVSVEILWPSIYNAGVVAHG